MRNKNTTSSITKEVQREVREREQRARLRAELVSNMLAIFNNPETPERISDALYEVIGDFDVPEGALVGREYLTRLVEENAD